METNASVVAPTPVADTTTAPPTTTVPTSLAVPDSCTVFAPAIPALPAYAKPFPDISRIEVFSRQNFKRWQERIYSTLDMH